MVKEYTVPDLFYTRWEDLHPRDHCYVYALYQAAQQTDKDDTKHGVYLLQILRQLRRNKLLASKITVAQAVDCFHDLRFLAEPWYHFPHLDNKALALVRPDDKMARSSFDQFIYADNEFTSFLAAAKDDHGKERFLYRLIVTLYLLSGEEYFDPETVELRARVAREAKAFKDWQLSLVYYTFAQVREHIMKRCKNLLPASSGESSKPKPSGPAWYRIKHQAARTHVFGSFQETGRANMYSVLDHLEILLQEQKDNAKPKAHRSR